MLLGISHVVIATCIKKSQDLENLLKVLGYEVDFVETDLINSKYKDKFLSKKNKTHDIIFFKCKGRTSIEIVRYENISYAANNFVISLSDKLEQTDKVISHTLGFEIFYNATHKFQYIVDIYNILILQTSSIDDEIFFWTKAGFVSKSNVVSISSPLQSWSADIYFIEKPGTHDVYLDNYGFNTVSIATNKIKECMDYDHLISTEIFSIKINKKKMNIVMIRRKGYNVEILEIK